MVKTDVKTPLAVAESLSLGHLKGHIQIKGVIIINLGIYYNNIACTLLYYLCSWDHAWPGVKGRYPHFSEVSLCRGST